MAARRRRQLVFQDSALLDPARQAALLDQVKRAGGTGIQQDVVWGDVRKGGQYDPAKLQALRGLFQAANARGLRPQVRLMGTPRYMAQSRPDVDQGLSYQHTDPGLIRTFAQDMASNFGGQVSKYSIWNEPNVDSFLGAPPDQAAKIYRRIYQAGYQGVKQGNRNAKVGFGEITSLDPRTAGAQSTVGFLRRVLAAGNKPLRADYAAIHPYQWSNPAERPHGMNAEFGGVANIAAVQRALGSAYKRRQLTTSTGKRVPLTASEFGYKHAAIPNAHVRAQYLQRALAQMTQAGVDSVNLYQLVPSRKGDYWDSSIANSRGRIDPRVQRAIRGTRR